MKTPTSLEQIDDDLSSSVGATNNTVGEFDPRTVQEHSNSVLYESSLIQWIIARRRLAGPRGHVFSVPESGHAGGNLEQIASSAPGLVLGLLPSGTIGGVERRTSAQFRAKFLSSQAQWPDLALSDSALIICVDGHSRGLPNQLYRTDHLPELTDWDGFSSVVSSLIRSVARESALCGKSLDKLNSISSIFYELFKNTHDHARYSLDGAILGDSIRGVYSRYYAETSLKAALSGKDAKYYSPAERFVESIFPKESASLRKGQVKRHFSGILELTVFDSGPGMAANWLGKKTSLVTPQEEADAICGCFGKGKSSISSASRGYGLWKVLRELKSVSGFIRIRTNRFNGYRQFSLLPSTGSEIRPSGGEAPKEEFYDWIKQFVSQPSNYPESDGTLVSILLPMGER